MAFVRSVKLLEDAKRGGYAIGAFNVENAEMVRAVAMAAKEMNAAVIMQTTSSTLKYMGPAYYAGLVKAATEEFGITAALHLDHGSSYELACQCIQSGYTSVMIDGSKLPFEENIALSKKVVEYASLYGIGVEAELGTIGGKEDEVEGEGSDYTDPAMAAEFVERTGVSSLAIAFGTAHGFYSKAPVLDLERILLVGAQISVPMVMHGGSGLKEEDFVQAVKNGISKVNFATELRNAFSNGIKECLREDPDVIDPKKYLTKGIVQVKELVSSRMKTIGSSDSDKY